MLKLSAALTLVFLLIASSIAQNPSGISDHALQQIADVLAQKRTFTNAEKKMSSDLVFAGRQARGVDIGPMAGLLRTNSLKDGLAQVEIKAQVSGPLLAKIESLGGHVGNYSQEFGYIRAEIPPDRLHIIAAEPSVRWIDEPVSIGHAVGSVTTQGYVAHQARDVVKSGIDGHGVKVGVLSDSATNKNSLSTLIASGDLGPNTTVLMDLPGGGRDEGAAMMEVVQDIAPKAQLYFATADLGEGSFASNITMLANSGCSIIVDDVFYYDEPPFQETVIDKAIDNFVAGGGLYITGAGNFGNLDSGTSGTWEGDFVNGGPAQPPVVISAKPSLTVHNFGTAGNPQTYDTILATGDSIDLYWADPLGASSNDLDLFLLDSTGSSIVASSDNLQTGTQNPYERIASNIAVNDRIVIVCDNQTFSNAVHLRLNGGHLSIATSGAITGHPSNSNALTVAATYWNSARKGVRPFNGVDNSVESFCSDGPRRIFFNPNGTAITPNSLRFSTSGGTLLQKPDVTGADGVVVKTPGFSPFFGASMSASHVAGIAALVKSAKPSLTGIQIRQILTANVWDAMSPGYDRDTGHGIVNAAAAVQAALAGP